MRLPDMSGVADKVEAWLPTREDFHDNKRRAMLKMLAIGGGAVVATKLLEVAGSFATDNMVLSERLFQNFRVVETGGALTFFDRQSGDEILVIDKR